MSIRTGSAETSGLHIEAVGEEGVVGRALLTGLRIREGEIGALGVHSAAALQVAVLRDAEVAVICVTRGQDGGLVVGEALAAARRKAVGDEVDGGHDQSRGALEKARFAFQGLAAHYIAIY